MPGLRSSISVSITAFPSADDSRRRTRTGLPAAPHSVISVIAPEAPLACMVILPVIFDAPILLAVAAQPGNLRVSLLVRGGALQLLPRQGDHVGGPFGWRFPECIGRPAPLY